MKTLLRTNQFKKDLRLANRRRLDLTMLDDVVERLRRGEALDPRHRPHRLSGRFAGFWEYHVQPDWLLLWREDEETLTLVRTGTHSDLGLA